MDNFNVSLTDALINAEVLLHQGEKDSGPLVKVRVLRHIIDDNGNIIDQSNEKIELNTTMDEAEFSDGQLVLYAANQIA